MNRGSIEMIAAMAICGTIGITVLISGKTEVDLIFYRCLFGSIVLLSVIFTKSYFSRFLKPRIYIYSVVGGICLLANWYFLFSAYKETSIGVATTVYNTQPIMMIAFGYFLFKEKITLPIVFWATISLIGLVFISEIFKPSQFGNHSNYLLGIVEALTAALLYALAAITARTLKAVPPALIAFCQLSFGAICLLPFADLSTITSPSFNSSTFATILLGFVHTGLMYMLLYGAIQKIEAWRVASISFLYPAIALILDATYLHVQLNFMQWAGVVLVLIGAAGINLKWEFPLKQSHLTGAAKE